MQLREAIRRNAGILQRRIWFLLIGVSLCSGTVFVINTHLPPVYQASALLMVNGVNGANTTSNDVYSNQALALSYSLLITQDNVLQSVASKLPGISVAQLRQEVSDAPVASTQIIEIRVQDSDARRAARIANEVASTFILVQGNSEVARLQAQLNQLSQNILITKSNQEMAQTRLNDMQKTHAAADAISQQRNLVDNYQTDYNSLQENYHQVQLRKIQAPTILSIAQQATVPAQPIGPRIAMNTVVATLLSLLLLVFLVLLLDWLDGTIYTGEDLARRTTLEVLGEMPHITSRESADLPVINNASIEEVFSHIGASPGSLSEGAHTFLVTGLRPAVGVSTAALNLAHFMALTGSRVLLIDANWRSPSLHKVFARSNDYGLTNYLTDIQFGCEQFQERWLKQWKTSVPNLWLLPAGDMLEDTGLKLRIPELKLLVQSLLAQYPPMDRKRAQISAPLPPAAQQDVVYQSDAFTSENKQRLIDVVIFDAPSFSQNADVLALASIADSTLLVIEVGKTRKEMLQRTQAVLRRLAAPVAGVIINRHHATARKTPTRKRPRSRKQNKQANVQTREMIPLGPMAQALPAMPPRLPETPPHLERIISHDFLKQTSLFSQTPLGMDTVILPTVDPILPVEMSSPEPATEKEPWQLSPRLRGISLPGLSPTSNGNLKLSSYHQHSAETDNRSVDPC